MLGFGFSFTSTQRTAFTALQTKGSIQNPALLCAQFDTIEYIKKEGHMGAQFFNLATHFARASAKSVTGPNGDLMDLAANAIPYDMASGKRRLLMEGQRVNLWGDSEDLSEWTLIDINLVSNNGVAPDGTLTADLVTKTGTDSTSPAMVFTSGQVSAGHMVYSAYVKDVSTDWLRLRFGAGSATENVFIQVSTETVGVSSTEGGIIPVGNGWYRVWITREIDGLSGISCAISPVSGDGNYTGSGSMLIWGGQVEYGQFPTSYIPTSGAPATRAPDLLTMNNLSGLDDGFWVVLPSFTLNGVDGGFDRVVQFDNGTSNNKCEVTFIQSTGKILVKSVVSSVEQARVEKSYTLGTTTKIAVRFGPDKFAVVWDDGTTYEDTDCDYVVPDRMYLAASNATGSGKPASMSLAGIMLHPPTITPAQMAAHLGGLS